MERLQWLGVYLQQSSLRADQRHIETPYTDTIYTRHTEGNNVYYTTGTNGIAYVYNQATHQAYINGISVHTKADAKVSDTPYTLTDQDVASYMVGITTAPRSILQERARRLGRTVTLAADEKYLNPGSFAALEYICTQPVFRAPEPEAEDESNTVIVPAGAEPRTLRYVTLYSGGNVIAHNFPVPVNSDGDGENDDITLVDDVSDNSVFESQSDYNTYREMHASNIMYLEGHALHVPPLDHGYLERVIRGRVQFPENISASRQQARHTVIFLASYFQLPTVPMGQDIIRYMDAWALAQRQIITNRSILAPVSSDDLDLEFLPLAPASHESKLYRPISATNYYDVSFLVVDEDNNYVYDKADSRQMNIWPTEKAWENSRELIGGTENRNMIPLFDIQVWTPPISATAATEFILNSDLYLSGDRGYPAFSLDVHLWLARELFDMETGDTNELFQRWLSDVRSQHGMDAMNSLNLFPQQPMYKAVQMDVSSEPGGVIPNVPMPRETPVTHLGDDAPRDWESSRAWPTYRHWRASVIQAHGYRSALKAKHAISITSQRDLVAFKMTLCIEEDKVLEQFGPEQVKKAAAGRLFVKGISGLTVAQVAANSSLSPVVVADRTHYVIAPSSENAWPANWLFATERAWQNYNNYVYGQLEAIRGGFINVPVDTPLSMFLDGPMPFSVERWLFFASILTRNNQKTDVAPITDEDSGPKWDTMTHAAIAVLFGGPVLETDLVCDLRDVKIIKADGSEVREMIAIPRTSGWANTALTVRVGEAVGTTTIIADDGHPWIGSITWPNVTWWTRAWCQAFGYETPEDLLPILKSRTAAYAYTDFTWNATLYDYTDPELVRENETKLKEYIANDATLIEDDGALLLRLEILSDVVIPFPMTYWEKQLTREMFLGRGTVLYGANIAGFLVKHNRLEAVDDRYDHHKYREAFSAYRTSIDRRFHLTSRYWIPETLVFPECDWELKTPANPNEKPYWKPEVTDMCRLWPTTADWEETMRLAQKDYYRALMRGDITDLSRMKTPVQKIALRIAIGFVLQAPFRPHSRHMVSDLALHYKLAEANRRIQTLSGKNEKEPVGVVQIYLGPGETNKVRVNVPMNVPGPTLQGCLDGDVGALVVAHQMWHENSVWETVEEWIRATRDAFAYRVKEALGDYVLPLDTVVISLAAGRMIRNLPAIGSSAWQRVTQFLANAYGQSLDLYTRMKPYAYAVRVWLTSAARRFANVAWTITKRTARTAHGQVLFAVEAFRDAKRKANQGEATVASLAADAAEINKTLAALAPPPPPSAPGVKRTASKYYKTFTNDRKTQDEYIKSLRNLEKSKRLPDEDAFFRILDPVSSTGSYFYEHRIIPRAEMGKGTERKPTTKARTLYYPKGVEFNAITTFLNDPYRVGTAKTLLDKNGEAIRNFLSVLIEPSNGTPDPLILQLLAWRQAVRNYSQTQIVRQSVLLILYLSRKRYGMFVNSALYILRKDERSRVEYIL